MAVSKKILSFLNAAKVRFDVVAHKRVYTAYDAAQTLRIKLSHIAKTLLIKIDHGYALVIVSAGHTLDLKKLGILARAKKISFPKEKEVMAFLKTTRAPVASFGSLYRIPVFLEKAFAKNKEGFFSVGSFTDSLRLKLKDFIALERPTVASFGLIKKFKVSKKKRKSAAKKTKPAPKKTKKKR